MTRVLNFEESSSPEPSPKARSFEELEYGGSEGSETARQLIFDDVFSDRDFDDDAFVDRSKKYESVEKVNESSQLVDTKRKRTKLENFFYEDEDDDGASDDSETARLRLLDESILPEGCDQSVYDKAFAVREQRWTMESRIKDELRNIEALQKDLDVQIRRKRVKERELGEDRKKLESLLVRCAGLISNRFPIMRTSFSRFLGDHLEISGTRFFWAEFFLIA